MTWTRTDRETLATSASAIIGYGYRNGGTVNQETVKVILPDTARLTEALRLSVARTVWVEAGGSISKWDDAPAESRARWAHQHVNRYQDVRVTRYVLTDDDTGDARMLTDVDTRDSMSVGYPAALVKLVDRAALTH